MSRWHTAFCTAVQLGLIGAATYIVLATEALEGPLSFIP